MRGVGVHHAKIPRSLASMFVREYNQQNLKALVCTSTLIEGVNTIAKNVFILDKKIDGHSNLNGFELQNIKGRAGRMMEHYVGSVYLYHPGPDKTLFSPEIPSLTSDIELPDSILLQSDPEGLSSEALSKRQSILSQSDLPPEYLTKWARLGVPALIKFAEHIKEECAKSLFPDFIWSGWGDYNEVAGALNQTWKQFNIDKAGLISAKQASMFANVLRHSDSLYEYLDKLLQNSKDRGYAKDADSVRKQFNIYLGLLRAAEYGLPMMLELLQDTIRIVAKDNVSGQVDYTYYMSSLRNWFLEPGVHMLDEEGLPAPLLWKLPDLTDYQDETGTNIEGVISRFGDRFSDFEKSLIA